MFTYFFVLPILEIVFKYTDPTLFIAGIRDKHSYEICGIYNGDTITYGSGNDHVVLKAGTKYFAAANVNYCRAGAKIKVDVE